MITIEELPEHIQNLPQKDWNKLIAFIPKIEQTKSFGKVIVGKEVEPGVSQFPYVRYDSLVLDFLETLDELKLIVVFDWIEWTEGKKVLDKKAYEGLDMITLCKLLTTIIRADRFSDGYMLSAFEHGDILEILKELKKVESINNS